MGVRGRPVEGLVAPRFAESLTTFRDPIEPGAGFARTRPRT